jgi:hypothetical protein
MMLFRSVFSDNTGMIIVPRELREDGTRGWKWANVERCVWNGPAWFTHKPRLASLAEYEDLSSLFRRKLSVQDVGVFDLLENLTAIKQASESQPADQPNDLQDQLKKLPFLYAELYTLSKAKGADINGVTAIK